MSCTWKEDKIYRYAEGASEPRLAEEFEEHLRNCPSCSREVVRARLVEAQLRAGIIPLPAPAMLVGRVAAAVAAEKRPRFTFAILGNRHLLPALISLVIALALGAGAYAVAPTAVMAVVQRALVFIPGIGISDVDEGNLVAAHPVEVEVAGATLTVTALFSNGKQTEVAYTVTGLPGGKEGWDSQRTSTRTPILRDQTGREYHAFAEHDGVGGSGEENTIAGGMTFQALPGNLPTVELVVPVDYLVPPAVLPGAERLEWVARIPLVRPAQSGLPQASSQSATATANGVTLRVAASQTGPERMVVLLEGRVDGRGRLLAVGGMGDDAAKAAVLRDDTGHSYQLQPEKLRVTTGSEAYHQDLYFEPASSQAKLLALSVAAVQVQEEASASFTVSLNGRKTGGVFAINRTLDLGEHKVQLKSATLEEENGQLWLYVDVDLGPTLNGRTLASFSVQGTDGGMLSYRRTGGAQVDRLGVVLEPGSGDVTIQLSDPLVEVQGPWELTFPAGGD